ncbi:MAG: SDR family oxidoreductase [Clostridiales Family XIII bacterium]|jgi:NAD(P)-dependent dehydrogenase (short-subunit alcohol dehydrogenase family)|nr:SDR family oxidoreductase [Clostridiales Family XIII bacterium]
MGRLDGKVALISGGAMGIGEADAALFAREGAKVAIGDIDEAAGAETAARLRAEGLDALFVKLDISSEPDWISAIETVIGHFGKLNIVVNNAGVSLGKDIEDTTLDDWNFIMGINATGVFLGTKYAIKYMKDNGENNAIVNRSSIDGQIAEAGLFAYCASKGAVTILTKSAALACGEKHYKIRVNSVHPGYVHTALTEKEAADSGMTPDAYFAKVGAQHPIGYIGKPADIAYADLYLASDESLFVTGSELTIDGGWTAQ